MKKLIVILLILALILCALPALAEAAPGYTVDLTGLLVAALWLAFDAILAWIARRVIPPAAAWLAEHTTTQQQERIWAVITRLVEAAEQTIVGPLRGPERLSWVIAELRARGITADRGMIEAAVREMHAQAAQTLTEAARPVSDAHTPTSDLPAALIDDGK